MTSLFKSLWHLLNSLNVGRRASSMEAITSSDSSPLDQLLLDDVVRKIFENLSIGDRVRMRLVSKSWRRMLMQDDIPTAVPEAPWLILSNDSYSKREYFLSEVCFKSLSEDRIYRFKLPNFINNNNNNNGGYIWCCCGSSRGWLLIAGQQGHNLHDTDMFLWNPVSGQTQKLPPLSTLPFFNEFVDGGIRSGTDNMSCFIPHVQVFSIGTVQCVVAIIFINPANMANNQHQQQHQLVLCTPHDHSWSTLGGVGGEKQHIYSDILFHNGKLYASCIKLEEELEEEEELDDEKIIRKGVYRVNLPGGGCEVEVDILRFVYEGGGVLDARVPIGFNISERFQIVEHLVESCSTGELLVVSAILDFCSYFINQKGCGSPPIQTFRCSQTRGFEVRRVDLVGDCLEKVSGSIGGGQEGIFVGGNDSLSLPTVAHINNEVEADSIYFATDDGCGFLGLYRSEINHEEEEEEDFVEDIYSSRLYIVRQQGVFNLQENRIQTTSLTNLRIDSGSITGWFTPKLF